MRIYTRTGDEGYTSLFGGRRVPKDALRVEAYGCVDELNAALGVVLVQEGLPGELSEALQELQRDLFVVGGDLACPEANDYVPRVKPEMTGRLERWIDGWEAKLERQKYFILPGGCPAAAWLHLARTICRRAERVCVALARQEAVNPELIRYLNRLSDALFVMARRANQEAGVSDVPWRPPR
ncbi:MAG: cob(I)yrinic acid a,c-diamide adenosyltransferase [Bacteroidetes bacterium]|nr:cob(I)yrinic acid a,c-diamide adenosyltransferase [Rhodothermia bacterium]MCS7156058.1 cob(I)yrinic acid a,c-diamide adenosyltransferase [Bacteroidota bacterium]MCX7907746.1 cob(I)yrinic acid a,c-diamide adenosyltransferase [Bacteroidota bacterium]MDW8137875.1 cob(I)yrinic acid a,c-diamide adenosyltransferase [Bacteroidota bacterium]MDW8286274.1 cob(I)yrinic acid a,c-diamide adenosyltransferase [Bacteroidota bacterium]